MSQHSPTSNGRTARGVPAARRRGPSPAAVLQPEAPPQPEAPFIIATLTEELAAANNNRIYLMSVLKQAQAEFAQAQAQWELERASLKAGRRAEARSEAPDAEPGAG